ncbi:hypothetical protein GCM10010277_73780 [Streptomyces longisporoflavus]|nr:hypothetical protein GCM10010277_73780 [Streptomyces longisporoflavus]
MRHPPACPAPHPSCGGCGWRGSYGRLHLGLAALELALVCSGPHAPGIDINPATGQRETQDQCMKLSWHAASNTHVRELMARGGAYGLWVTQSSSAGQRCAQSCGSVSL